MNHTTTAPETDGQSEATAPQGPVANPRRVRLGADGRPLTGPVTTTSD